jgi:hypothetical protein
MTSIFYLSFGLDPTCMDVIHELKLHTVSTPFDWVVSTPKSIYHSIMDNFNSFHTGVRYYSKSRVIDKYGFIFPRDYPTTVQKNAGKYDIFSENPIVPNWREYENGVLEKYKLRANNFISVMQSDSPCVFLYRGEPEDIIQYKLLIKNIYKKENVAFVVASSEENINEYYLDEPYIFVCHPEKNGNWNEISVWKEAIERATDYLLKNK